MDHSATLPTLDEWEDLGGCLRGIINGKKYVTDTLIYIDHTSNRAMDKTGLEYVLGNEKAAPTGPDIG